MTFMPDWVQTLAWFLPFHGRSSPRIRRSSAMSDAELLRGLGMQVFWALVGIGIFSLAWRRAIRRYTAVGN